MRSNLASDSCRQLVGHRRWWEIILFGPTRKFNLISHIVVRQGKLFCLIPNEIIISVDSIWQEKYFCWFHMIGQIFRSVQTDLEVISVGSNIMDNFELEFIMSIMHREDVSWVIHFFFNWHQLKNYIPIPNDQNEIYFAWENYVVWSFVDN